jgi:glycosyltransferase involved in cell wall biosynthesis
MQSRVVFPDRLSKIERKRVDRMDRPAISVVIPAYNAASTLVAALDSVLLQENVVSEIVVVDDGSTDNTLDVARRYEPRVRVITGPNRGVSSARNLGFAETQAPWILFLDSDDWLKPGTLAARLSVAFETDADVVITDWSEAIDTGTGDFKEDRVRAIDWPAIKRDAETATATNVWATTAAILYRRGLIERIGGFRVDLPVIQDARLLFDAARCGAKFAHAPHIGACYRHQPGSLSRRNHGIFWEDVFRNGRQIEAIWTQAGQLNEERRRAVADIYENATRGLFAAGHPSYFAAMSALRLTGLPRSRHAFCSAVLVRVLGIKPARQLLRLLGKM